MKLRYSSLLLGRVSVRRENKQIGNGVLLQGLSRGIDQVWGF